MKWRLVRSNNTRWCPLHAGHSLAPAGHRVSPAGHIVEAPAGHSSAVAIWSSSRSLLPPPPSLLRLLLLVLLRLRRLLSRSDADVVDSAKCALMRMMTMIGKGWLITCTEGRKTAPYSWYGKERPRELSTRPGWVKSVSEASHFQSPRFCTLSTANIRCILCHINNMALDAPMICYQKCAKTRDLVISGDNDDDRKGLAYHVYGSGRKDRQWEGRQLGIYGKRIGFIWSASNCNNLTTLSRGG